MLHKISEFISKIRVIKEKADQLETMKYGEPKASRSAIDNMIQDIFCVGRASMSGLLMQLSDGAAVLSRGG